MKRHPGRPPLDRTASAPSAHVHLTLTADEYDKADRHCKRKRETLQETIRRGLKQLLHDERGF